MTEMMNTFGPYVVSIVGALILLVVGWLIAALLARATRAALKRTTLSTRLSNWVSGKPEDSAVVELWAGRLVFYLILLFVLVGFFQVLGLHAISIPLRGFLDNIFAYAPRLIAPAILALVAWLVAKGLRYVVQRGLAKTNLDDRLRSEAEFEAAEGVQASHVLGEAVYWLTLLLFLPAVLHALGLEGLLGPVRAMVDKLLAFTPNLFAAALILLVGWFVARLLRRIVTNLMSAIGADRISEQVRLKAALGQQSLSALVGLVVYILVLIPVAVAALNALAIEAVTEPASQMLNSFLAALPRLFAAGLLLVIAYVVARLLGGLVESLLGGVGFDTLFVRLGLAKEPPNADKASLSAIVGNLVLVVILLFAVIEALNLIGFNALALLGSDLLAFAAKVAIGLFVIGLGLYLANLVDGVVRAIDTSHPELFSQVARVAIIVFAFAIGLGQMGVASEIIMLAFGILLGAVALALAVAFGVGGRDAAGRFVENWLKSIEDK
jgi:hypothetical protein